MSKVIYLLIACLWTTSALAADIEAMPTPIATETAKGSESEAAQMEQDLQQLTWRQFKFVIESVPKMKADVEAYGPLGWQYVQANYATYGWKKNIKKLDDTQKKLLAELIETAKSKGTK